MDPREQQTLEIMLEDGTRRVLTLEVGRDTGVWCVTNDGALVPATPRTEGARLFVRYDGGRVFVGSQWQELQREIPVSAGGLRVAHRSGVSRIDDDDATAIRPPPFGVAPPDDEAEAKTRIAPPPAGFEFGMKRTPASGIAVSRPPAEEPNRKFDDETRIGPPPEIRKQSGALPSAAPAAGYPSPLKMDAVTRTAPPPAPIPPKLIVTSPPAAQSAQVDTVPGKGKTAIKPIHFAFLGLLGVTGVFLAMSSSRSQVPAPVVKSAPAPSAKAVPSSTAASLASSRATGSGTAIPSAASSSSALAASSATFTKPGSAAAPEAPTVAAADSAGAPPASTKAEPSSSAAAASATPLDGTERAAVLAVESGAIDKAARLYDGLAAAHPDKPAYREAARILHAKAAP